MKGEPCRWMNICKPLNVGVWYLCEQGADCAARKALDEAYRQGFRDGLLQAKQVVEAMRRA